MSFPQKNATMLSDMARQSGAAMGRVLDLGCSVGGGSFELTRNYKEVVGIDISSRCVTASSSCLTTCLMNPSPAACTQTFIVLHIIWVPGFAKKCSYSVYEGLWLWACIMLDEGVSLAGMWTDS